MILGRIKRLFFGDVRRKASISSSSRVSSNVEMVKPENCVVEEYVYVGPNAKLQCLGRVHIHRGTIIGPSISIYTANHNFRNATSIPYDSTDIIKDVIIYENVWIGGNVIILPGVTIGEGAIIGAGSVIVKNVKPYAIMGGNPAVIIGERDREEYLKLKSEDKIYMKQKLEL